MTNRQNQETFLRMLIDNQSTGSRYAYFPLTKYWNKEGDKLEAKGASQSDSPHLYVHIPFCKSLCTFCGCNIKISQEKEDHLRYVSALSKEIELLKNQKQLGEISGITLGGGSPNILNPYAKDAFLTTLEDFTFRPSEDSLAEIDPTEFTPEDFQFFKELGVTRYSFGVQDFDPNINENVNRHQSIEDLLRTKEILGTSPFGIDLIYGLPLQRKESLKQWENGLKKLAPNTVSLYPLAQVPWLATYQNAFGDFSPLKDEARFSFFIEVDTLLRELGYQHFGFGHYFKDKDQLNLRSRRVSGFYSKPYEEMVSIGVGAISENHKGLHQNEKVLDKYLHKLLVKGKIPTLSWHGKSVSEANFFTLIKEIESNKKIPLSTLEKLPLPIEWCLPNGDITEMGVYFLKVIFKGIENIYL